MYVHAEGQAVGKDTWSGGAHQSGAHRRSERCAHIHGAVCTPTKTSVCTAHTWCTVEIVVVWTSDGADVVLSLGRGSETG